MARPRRDTNATDERAEFDMNQERNRLASFKDWPFDENCECTPEKMAAAGFYHCPTETEPDLVKCFMCMKELDGWEPTDDPWEEHKSHMKKCPYLALKKPVEDMTQGEFLKLEAQRQVNRFSKSAEAVIAEFENNAAETRKELERLA